MLGKSRSLYCGCLSVIFDSAFIKLCVCGIKSNFLSWAIRPVFADPVTYVWAQLALREGSLLGGRPPGLY